MLQAAVNITLSNLHACEGNIRKTHDGETIKELAASIQAHGLLQPLLVSPEDYTAVIAGGRRLAALKLLAERGDIANDYQVPCTVAREDADISELSLAENIVREAMHPIDQAQAFVNLVEKEIPIDAIARRFGVTPVTVHKRLAMARLSPKVLDSYRRGEINLAQAQAFTFCNDHEAQESVLDDMYKDDDASTIREALADEGFVRADDKRARFVGVENYTAAGGVVSRDLFTESARGIYLQDEKLLEKLAMEKLAALAKEIQTEGWQWVDYDIEFSYGKYSDYRSSQPQKVELSAADTITLADLRKKHSEVDSLRRDAEDDSDEEMELAEQRDLLKDQIAGIEARTKEWTDRQKESAGVILHIGHDGGVAIDRGRIKPKVTKAAANKKGNGKGDEPKKKEKAEEREIPEIVQLPASLVENLTAHKSAAVAFELSIKPDIALAILVYQFLCHTMMTTTPNIYSLDVSCTEAPYPKDIEEKGASKGYDRLQARRELLLADLPCATSEETDDDNDDEDDGKSAILLKWCLEQDQKTLLDYLAFCMALSVDMVTQSAGNANSDSNRILMETLGVNMNEYFIPDAENFFGKIPALQILAVLQQAGVEINDDWKKLKKADLALLAEGELGRVNPLWLPAVMTANNTQAEEEDGADAAGDDDQTEDDEEGADGEE